MHQRLQNFSFLTENVEITVHRSKDAILALVPAWLELLSTKKNCSYYHHPAWFLALKDTLCKETLCCVLITRDDQPVAILPVCEQENALSIMGPAHDHISLGDWILRSADALDIILINLPRIASALNCSNWAKLKIGLVPEYSDVFGGLALESSPGIKTLSKQSWLYRIRQVKRSFWFNCTLEASAKLSREELPLPSKLKRNLRNRRKRLNASGEVTFVQSNDQWEHREAFSDFLRVESVGWKGEQGSGTAIANHDDLILFYKSLLEINLPGWLPSVNRLLVDDQVAAAQFQIKTYNTISLLKVAFNETLSGYSPGLLALEDCLLSSFNDNESERLSLVTCPQWAQRWHPEETPVYYLSFYNCSVRGKVTAVLDDTLHKLRRTQPLIR